MTHLTEMFGVPMGAVWIATSWGGQFAIGRGVRHICLCSAGDRLGDRLVHGCFAVLMAASMVGAGGFYQAWLMAVLAAMLLFAGLLAPAQCRIWYGVRGRQLMIGCSVTCLYLVAWNVVGIEAMPPLSAAILFFSKLDAAMARWRLALREMESMRIKILSGQGHVGLTRLGLGVMNKAE